MALAWLKDAIAHKDIVVHLTHVLVKDGNAYASDGRIIAAHPFPHDGPFLVPGELFAKLLNSTAEPRLEVEKECVRVTDKKSKLKGKLSILDPELWPFESSYEGQWTDLPEELVPGFRQLRPFVSDNATKSWATSIGIKDGYLYATNNIVVARIDLRSVLDPDINLLVPYWAVDFVLARTEGLDGFATTESSMLFRWENGGWMRCPLMVGEFPPQAGAIIDARPEVEAELSPEWLAAFRRVADLTDGPELKLYGNRIVGGSGRELEAEDEAESPVPEGQEFSMWDPGHLRDVIAAGATHFNPSCWPLPARFKGAGKFEGIILGRRPV